MFSDSNSVKNLMFYLSSPSSFICETCFCRLGEVDHNLFDKAKPIWFAYFLFIIFMLFVVILLANVLIAIVTDAYGIIRHERAAMVFWANRLTFVLVRLRRKLHTTTELCGQEVAYLLCLFSQHHLPSVADTFATGDGCYTNIYEN